MAMMVVLGFLAAFGVLGILWTAVGWLLPGGKGGTTVLLCKAGLKEEAFIRRWCWLRNLGLMQGPLLIVDQGLAHREKDWLKECRFVEFCSLEELPARLELERNRIE